MYVVMLKDGRTGTALFGDEEGLWIEFADGSRAPFELNDIRHIVAV